MAGATPGSMMEPVCPINVSKQLRSAPHGGLLGAMSSSLQVAGDELHRGLAGVCYLGPCPQPMECVVGELTLYVALFFRRIRRSLAATRGAVLPQVLAERLESLTADVESGELLPGCSALSSQLEGRENEDACEHLWEFGMLCYLSFEKGISSRLLDLHAAQLSLAVPRQALPQWRFNVELGFERAEVLEKLLEGLEADTRQLLIVEIGVWEGETSTVLLQRFPALRMLLVDPYHLNADASFVLQHGEQEAGDMRQRFDTAVAALQPFGERASFLMQRSTAVARWVARIADLVFVDGDHRYAAVRADLDAWWPKLLSGGIMAGHDYNSHHMGVVLAVNEFAAGRGLHLSLAPDIWWLRKP